MYPLIISCLVLCGCATEVVRQPEAVIVERKIMIQLAPELLAGCPGEPQKLNSGSTNGELLAIEKAQETYIVCLSSRLQAIRDVQPK